MTSTRCRRRGGAKAVALAAVVTALLVIAPPAGAHSTLERSEPPNGGAVAVGRTTFSLWFTDPISVQSSSFEIRTSDGTRIAATATAAASGGGRFVELHTGPLPRAIYELDWSVLSLEDGHPSRGSFVFGAGSRPTVVPGGDGRELPGTWSLVVRWIDLAALMLAIGALALALRAAAGATVARARLIGAVATTVAVVTGAITPLLRTPRDGGSLGVWLDGARGTLADTPWGHLWLGREGALVLAAVVLWAWLGSKRWGCGLASAALVALVAATVLEASAGHASALPRQSGVAIAAAAVHLVAAGVWAGGLVVLATCLAPAIRRRSDSRAAVMGLAWRAFSPLAAVSTAVLLATGLYESGRQLPALGSIGSTIYGGAVATKVALVALALAFAGVSTLRVNPRLAGVAARLLRRPQGWTPLARVGFTTLVVAEVAVLVAAVAAGALLTSVPTPRELAAAKQETSPQIGTTSGLFVTFEEVSLGPTQSRLIVRARSLVKPAPAPITGIEVRLSGPSGASQRLPLARVEPGRFEAATSRLGPGVWRADVAVLRRGLPAAVAPLYWPVTSTDADEARPLEVWTSAFAAVLLAALAAAVGVRRRMRPRTGAIPINREGTVRQP